MNFSNPYGGLTGSALGAGARSGGFLSSLFRNGINWGTILNNTHRTLGVVNQAIPVIKQVSPILKNAKTMFKVMNEFKKTETTPNAPVQSAPEAPVSPTKERPREEPRTTRASGPNFFI